MATTTAIAATSATTTTTAAMATAPPAETTATASAGLRPGFVHGNGATVQLFAIEGGNCRLRFRITAHFDKTETLGAARVAVDDDLRRLHRTMRAKLLFQHAVVDAIAKVAYVEFFSQLPISHQD